MAAALKSSALSIASPRSLPSAHRSFAGISELLHKDDHFARLGQYAAQLWRSKAMTDVVIVVQEREFRAHKAVLACYSPYLSEALVRPGFSDVHCLQLPSVTARSFAVLLNYMYTGELKVSCRELCEVYRAARKLGIQGALKKCIELLFVTPHHLENMVYLYVTAQKMDMVDSALRAFRMMVIHFERVMLSQEFLDLEKDHIIDLISSDELGTRGEVVVFLAALKWLNHKFLEREEYAVDVLDNIRFELMTMDEIITCYHPPILPGIMEIPDVRSKLLTANCFISAKAIGRENLFPQLAPRPRNFLVQGEPMKLWETIQFEPGMAEFIKRIRAVVTIQAYFRGYRVRKRYIKELNDSRRAAAIIQAAFRGHMVRKIISIKKKTNEKKILEVEQLASLTSTTPEFIEDLKPYYASGLEALSEMQSGEPSALNSERLFPLSSDVAEPLKGNPNVPNKVIYVMGAYEVNNKVVGKNPIFKFSTKTCKWELITRTEVPIHESRIVSTAKHLYLIGGSNPENNIAFDVMMPLRECYRYEFSSDSWIPTPSMNFGRTLHAAIRYNDSILAIGGKNEISKILSSIEVFNPKSKAWAPYKRDLPEPRMCMGVAVQNNLLWIAGGFTSIGSMVAVTDTVWTYNEKLNAWTEKNNLPVPMGFVTLISDGSKLYSLGGAERRQDEEGNITFESTDFVYLYDNNDGWVPQKPMPQKCHSVVATLTGGNIYVFGGYKTHTMSQLKELFFYDGGTGDWTTLGWLPYECSSHLLAAAQNLV